MANSLACARGKFKIAKRAGTGGAGRPELLAANRGPLLAMGSSAVVLLAPLFIFTGIDKGWFSGDGNLAARPGGLVNWAVEPERTAVDAGEVTFEATRRTSTGARRRAGAGAQPHPHRLAAAGSSSPRPGVGARTLTVVWAGDYGSVRHHLGDVGGGS
jgi:hypothetical protein